MPLGPACLLPLVVLLGALAPASSSPVGEAAAAQSPPARVPSAEGLLATLNWDDSLDGRMGGKIHSTRLRWKRLGRHLSGGFVGPVGGRSSPAMLLGEITRGSPAVLVLKQIEAGWSCHYLLHQEGEHSWVGTWRDTRGRSGDVVIHEDRTFIPPLRLDLPKQPCGESQPAPKGAALQSTTRPASGSTTRSFVQMPR